ncbi:MAG: NifU family protein [Firmicutes bacterium]|nr:NifU family protein [Bacillota bacterium]
MREKIIEALEQIRPFLQRDGGDVQFVDYTEDKVVLVELQGHCAGCPHSQYTVKEGIEGCLVEMFGDNVKAVEAINALY